MSRLREDAANRSRPSLISFGWWENFAPSLHGRSHLWTTKVWSAHIDDMAAHGVRVLILYLHWYSTGYCSMLSWLDQPTYSLNIAAQNGVLRRLLRRARGRRIRVYLANHVYVYDAKAYAADSVSDRFLDGLEYWSRPLAVADAGAKETRERIIKMFVEQAELFPTAAGLLIEGEGKDWDGNYQPKTALTEREADLTRWVERAVRRTGFAGEIGYVYSQREIDAKTFVEKTKGKIRLVPYNYYPEDRAGEKGLAEAVATSVPVTYVVDGQVGVSRRRSRYTGRFHAERGWKIFTEQANRYRPNDLVFFGYEWCDIAGEPEEHRQQIYKIVQKFLRNT